MTTTILLIRHAAHHDVGRVLSGRAPGLALSAAGREQALATARFLSAEPLVAIQSSPIERALRTAQEIARPQRIAVETTEALNEIDFGAWTGKSFAELAGEPAWTAWNAQRSSARVPEGESMPEAQARAMAHVDRVAGQYQGGTIALVTHCDIIRAIVCEVLGLSLDRILAFEVDPASITRLAMDRGQGRLLSLNERPAAR